MLDICKFVETDISTILKSNRGEDRAKVRLAIKSELEFVEVVDTIYVESTREWIAAIYNKDITSKNVCMFICERKYEDGFTYDVELVLPALNVLLSDPLHLNIGLADYESAEQFAIEIIASNLIELRRLPQVIELYLKVDDDISKNKHPEAISSNINKLSNAYPKVFISSCYSKYSITELLVTLLNMKLNMNNIK